MLISPSQCLRLLRYTAQGPLATPLVAALIFEAKAPDGKLESTLPIGQAPLVIFTVVDLVCGASYQFSAHLSALDPD